LTYSEESLERQRTQVREVFLTGKDGVKKPPFFKNGGMGREEEFPGQSQMTAILMPFI